MPGINRTVFARAAGMLCLLGIGLGIGTIIFFHLLRHILKRKRKDDDADDEIKSSASAAPCEPLENQEKSSENDSSIDPNVSFRSLEESGYSCDIDHDADDLDVSICSDDSIYSHSEYPADLHQSDIALRKRNFDTKPNDQSAGDEASEVGSNPPDGDSWKSDDDNVLPVEVIRRSSSSSNDLPSSLKLLDLSSKFDNAAPDLSIISTGDYSTTQGLESAKELPLFRRNSQSVLSKNFDHSTPEDHLPLSSCSRRDRLGWMYFPSNVTLDSDVPKKSLSCYDCASDGPFSTRSSASIDLGEMSSISNAVSEIVDNRKLSCSAVNNMEKIQAELMNIQNEVEEIRDKVGQLRSQEQPQYKLCHLDCSVDEDGDLGASARRKMLHEMHQTPNLEAGSNRRSSDYTWDYDFDLAVKDKKFESGTGFEFEEERVGQLESFVVYRTKKAVRDSFRRRSFGLSQSSDVLHLSRSDSVFGCVNPFIDDDFSDQKSCSLFDVNRRLSGQFLLSDVEGIPDF